MNPPTVAAWQEVSSYEGSQTPKSTDSLELFLPTADNYTPGLDYFWIDRDDTRGIYQVHVDPVLIELDIGTDDPRYNRGVALNLRGKNEDGEAWTSLVTHKDTCALEQAIRQAFPSGLELLTEEFSLHFHPPVDTPHPGIENHYIRLLNEYLLADGHQIPEARKEVISNGKKPRYVEEQGKSGYQNAERVEFRSLEESEETADRDRLQVVA